MTLVAAETAYPAQTPGARVRITNFIPHLSGHGIELDYRPSLTEDEYDLITSSAPSARKALVLAAAAARFARQGRVPTGTLSLVHRLRFMLPLPILDPPRKLDVYDFDDALFVGSIGHENSSFGWAKREARRWHSYTSRARLVIAGNEYLAARANMFADRVKVVPSCVDPSIQPVRKHQELEVARVGWIGSRSTASYLDQVLPALESINRHERRVELVVVGAKTSHASPWITFEPWSLETEAALLASFDIGIMPLPDDAWTRGKCGYKLLQYFAAGVPAIASPVGVNSAIIGDERGLLASSVGDWQTALEGLMADAQIRKEMGANARDFVERKFSYEYWSPQLAEMLKALS